MRTTIGLMMLLAVGIVALAADTGPPGQDQRLIFAEAAPPRVEATAPAAVETEVAEVARSGSIGVQSNERMDARTIKTTNGHYRLKRWRAWNAG